MSILRNMLGSCITLKGLSYYKRCWNLEVENAKVVQGSSHDVVGLTEILLKQTQQISDKIIPITLPAKDSWKEL